jgi:hypothetical protein
MSCRRWFRSRDGTACVLNAWERQSGSNGLSRPCHDEVPAAGAFLADVEEPPQANVLGPAGSAGEV